MILPQFTIKSITPFDLLPKTLNILFKFKFFFSPGLLSHMEHMRMDPKHQFAAQYVLSRAAAERRERESLIAAAVAASNVGGFGIGGKCLSASLIFFSV